MATPPRLKEARFTSAGPDPVPKPGRSRKPAINLAPIHEIGRLRAATGLSGRVYSFVKGLLLEGSFAPQAWIQVDDIAGRMGVSRQPVLDALKRLEAEGFVVIVPQVGCHTRSYPAQEVQDFYCLLAAGENIICELAAKRATKEEIATMRSISRAIGKLRSSRLDKVANGQQYRVLNRQLHFCIRVAARSDCTTEVVERMGDQSDFFVSMSGATLFADRVNSAHDEHEIVIQAIADRDPKLASRTMSAHIMAIADRIRMHNLSES